MALPALLSALGTIGGGLIGAGAQESASARNANTDQMNMWLREMERQDQTRMAARRQGEAKLGGTDAQGNTTMFVPGEGWKTFLSSQGQQLSDAQQQEQMMRLMRDLPMQRDMMEKNYATQFEDRDIEAALRDEFVNAREDPEAMRRRLMGDAAQGINGAFDEATNAASRSSIRRGTSNLPAILAAFAGERASAIGDAFKNAGLEARTGAEDITNQRRGNLANLISNFAQRGRALPGAQFQPMNVAGNADQMAGRFAGLASNAGAQLTSSMGKQGGTGSMVQPQYGLANTVSQGGQALGNIFASQQAGSQQAELMKRLGTGAGGF
jgi:hypothetical protein